MAKIGVREKQFRMNLDDILGGYENGRQDYPNDYVDMTANEWFKYVMQDMYHMKVITPGYVVYGDNICKDLRFLGNARMREIILEEVREEGWLVEDEVS